MTSRPGDARRRAEVLAAQERFWEALRGRDRAGFERVLAQDFVCRSPGEADQSRGAFIDVLLRFPGAVRRVGSDNLGVHFIGDAAIVSGVQEAELELPDGTAMTDRVAITNVFVPKGDQWVLLLAHAVQLA
jgi:ketosteroid isomerase-like protein